MSPSAHVGRYSNLTKKNMHQKTRKNPTNSQSIAALTARQYRNNKRLEFEEMKRRLQDAVAQVEHYKSLYEMTQATLMDLSQRFVLCQAVVNNEPNKRILNPDPAQLSPSSNSLSCDTESVSSIDDRVLEDSPRLPIMPEWDQVILNWDPVLSDI